MIPLTLGIWLVYATTRTFSFSLLGSYVCAALVVMLTPEWALAVRVVVALVVAAVFAVMSNQLFQIFRRAGGGEATQIIAGLVVLELTLVMGTGFGLSEPTRMLDSPAGVWMRGLLGIVGLLSIVALLWGRLGHSLQRVIDAPILAAELGVPVERVELAACVGGGLLCGASALLDSIDPAIGAGPRNVFPAAIQATLAVLLAVAMRGFSGYYAVAAVTVAVSVAGAAFAFLLPDGERLLCPVLLITWLLLRPGKVAK